MTVVGGEMSGLFLPFSSPHASALTGEPGSTTTETPPLLKSLKSISLKDTLPTQEDFICYFVPENDDCNIVGYQRLVLGRVRR